jgi:hypothetical protein
MPKRRAAAGPLWCCRVARTTTSHLAGLEPDGGGGGGGYGSRIERRVSRTMQEEESKRLLLGRGRGRVVERSS